MIIRHNGNTHTIARMTGNQHNILEITLTDTRSPIKIKPLILKGEESTINITPEEVDFHVARGVNLIYGKYQRTFFISAISFCPSDSQPANIYAMLAFHLLEDIIQGETKGNAEG